MTEITVEELRRRRDAGENLVVLDVREPDELATARIAGTLDIPMREVPQRLGELPHDRAIVVMCHHGGRSEHVTRFLNANGYANAVNLADGIDGWSQRVDPNVPRY